MYSDRAHGRYAGTRSHTDEMEAALSPLKLTYAASSTASTG